MNCPKCGAGANEHGIYRGASIIQCLKCGWDYDFKTGETMFRGTSLEAGSKRRFEHTVLQEDNGEIE